MIGDWVVFNDKPAQVIIIDNWENEISYFDADAGGVLTFKTKDIKPIALTKEMLLLNGFEDHGCYFSLQCDMIRIVYKDELFWINVDTWSIDIRHVHRLQHIMCICGLYDLANNFKIE